MNHCCKLITDFINDPRIPITYTPEWRFYYIEMEEFLAQGMFYCPWCGIKLPQELGDEYHEILEKEYGVDDFDDEKMIP